MRGERDVRIPAAGNGQRIDGKCPPGTQGIQHIDGFQRATPAGTGHPCTQKNPSIAGQRNDLRRNACAGIDHAFYRHSGIPEIEGGSPAVIAGREHRHIPARRRRKAVGIGAHA